MCLGYVSYQSGKRLLVIFWLSVIFVSCLLIEYLEQVMLVWEYGIEWVLVEVVLFLKDGINGEGWLKNLSFK